MEARKDARVKERVEARMEARVEARVDERVEARMEARVEERVETRIEATVEDRVEARMEARVEERVEEQETQEIIVTEVFCEDSCGVYIVTATGELEGVHGNRPADDLMETGVSEGVGEDGLEGPEGEEEGPEEKRPNESNK